MTLQEIDDKILEYRNTRDSIEKKILSLVENLEFKRMQNGTDSIEVQNISDTINTLRLMKTDCDTEIDKLEKMKMSCCERKKQRSLLRSNFYGY